MVEAERPGRIENDRMDREDQEVKVETSLLSEISRREQSNHPEEAGPPSFVGNGPTLEQNMNALLVGTRRRKKPQVDRIVKREAHLGSRVSPCSVGPHRHSVKKITKRGDILEDFSL
ncbi:hypothetical protein PGTUg99_017858 [Puccinia graminis f. sp. tritici]|uniref:Uncharacterized protein n=1 Tax=Puccinia graminis f. sp. tritici TaxID=56615 RepID=A0A5B0MH48_PUCGR|nr:hypothetical protein PGTUg99_017858 [Puccinia graminis f. sp. tritici]